MTLLQRPGPGADPDAPLSVAQINAGVRSLLEAGWSRIWVEAEVGDMKRAQSGHIYFSLTDPGGSAQLSAVMWRSHALRYGNRIASGAKIRCFGRLTLYEARGSFQMVVERAMDAGAGLKAEQLEALKKRLYAEGLFDRERKKPLPAFPATVGIVTSRQGAAFRDIVKVARRRFPVRLVIAHAQVQGASAAAEIVAAIERLEATQGVDVVIIGRGGGSSEDLDAFNDEAVVRAVARCTKPTVSAVGHEIDTTLTDLAADRRAATPSEAAELAVPDARAIRERLAQTQDTIEFSVQKLISQKGTALSLLTASARARDPRVRLRRGAEVIARARETLLRTASRLPASRRSAFLQASERLFRIPEPRMLKARSALTQLDDRLRRVGDELTRNARTELGAHAAKLDGLSPLASLSRGYAVVQRQTDGHILRSAVDAPPGTDVSVTLAEGALLCSVTESKTSKR